MNYALYFMLLFASGVFIYNLLGVITYYLQLNGYNHLYNCKTIVSKLSIEVVCIYFAPSVISLVINICLRTSKVLWVFMLAEILAYFALIFVLFSAKPVRKVKLNITPRYLRMYILSLLLSVVVVGYFAYKIIFSMPAMFGSIYLTPILVAASVLCSGIMLYPVERAIYHHYLSKASRVLSLRGGLIRIAITGSYGKTSTKYMLHTILSEKYRVTMTPNSYNTPMGISRVILDSLRDDTDIFIMEFGANRKGDIKYLCDHFKPNIGIITGIGKAHISTFGSIDNIVHTKGALVNNLYGASPFAVFNADNKYVAKCRSNCKVPSISCGLSNGDMVATNIVTGPSGTTFDVYEKGKLYVSLHTKLVGLQNISNIMLCVGLAKHLRLSKQHIINGVAKLDSVRARMEVVPHSSGAIIINDGYNSNPYSARIAVDNMGMYNKPHKIVLTPGMVELGKDQYLENYEWARYMATKVNIVYIVGKENYTAIRSGLIDGGMRPGNIRQGALSQVMSTLTINDILLIENDLPDNYN